MTVPEHLRGTYADPEHLPLDVPFWAETARLLAVYDGTSGERVCEQCGAFYRRVQTGSGSVPGAHRTSRGEGKRFCSRECHRQYRRDNAQHPPPKRSDAEARAVWEAAEADRTRSAALLADALAAERRLLDGL